MSSTTVKFNVGGTVFEVAVSTIQSQPEALLAKMIDGRFLSGKDDSGAFFVDRDPLFFKIVLDVYRDNKVYPLPPGVTRERVLAELEFYGLQDFEGVPMNLSAEATLMGVGKANQDLFKWQQEQLRLGQDMLTEGCARLLLASGEMAKGTSTAQGFSTTLKISPIDLSRFSGAVEGAVGPNAVAGRIDKLCAGWNLKATVSAEGPPVNVAGKSLHGASVKLERVDPAAGA